MNARCVAAVYLQTKRLSVTSRARSSGAAGGEASPELFSVKHPPGPRSCGGSSSAGACACVCTGGVYLAGSSVSKECAGPSWVLIIALVWKQPKGKQQKQKKHFTPVLEKL